MSWRKDFLAVGMISALEFLAGCGGFLQTSRGRELNENEIKIKFPITDEMKREYDLLDSFDECIVYYIEIDGKKGLSHPSEITYINPWKIPCDRVVIEYSLYLDRKEK